MWTANDLAWNGWSNYQHIERDGHLCAHVVAFYADRMKRTRGR